MPSLQLWSVWRVDCVRYARGEGQVRNDAPEYRARLLPVSVNLFVFLEPAEGFEPPTLSLQIRITERMLLILKVILQTPRARFNTHLAGIERVIPWVAKGRRVPERYTSSHKLSGQFRTHCGVSQHSEWHTTGRMNCSTSLLRVFSS